MLKSNLNIKIVCEDVHSYSRSFSSRYIVYVMYIVISMYIRSSSFTYSK